MSAEFRWVFDVNVFVSAALFSSSIPARAVFRAIEIGDLLLSETLFAELERTLRLSRFDRYLAIDDRELFLETVVERAKLVAPTEAIQACRDSGDDYLLELAVAGAASAVITGAGDLLVLNPFREIEIISPTQFLAKYFP